MSLKDLQSNSVGIREGEIFEFVGNTKSNELVGTRVIFHSKKGEIVYPPSYMPDYKIIRDTMSIIPYFSNMSERERESYLKGHMSDTSLRLDQYDNVLMEFESLSCNREDIDQELLYSFLDKNPDRDDGYWEASEFIKIFPTPSGKPALTLRGSLWCFYYDPKLTSDYEGTCIDPHTGNISQIKKGERVVDYGPYCIKEIKTTNTNFKDFVTSILDNYSRLTTLLSWVTPSGHKSLIQKLIRTKASTVRNLDEVFDSEDVMTVSFCMLLISPGSLVPSIKKFVTGFQSATKRLAVSIVEDGYVSDPKVLVSLLASSLYNRDYKHWKPDNKTVKWWIESAISAMKSPKYYNYNCHNPQVLKNNLSEYSISSLLLEELKSFHTDLYMFQSFANNYGSYSVYKSKEEFEMDIFHFIDNHCYPDFLFLLDYTGYTYTQLVSDTWNLVSGINNRKRNYKENELSKNIINAQKRAWLFKTQQLDSKDIYLNTAGSIVEDMIYTVKKNTYSIADSFLSPLVGTINIKIESREYLGFIKTDDIHSFKAIRVGGRSNKEKGNLAEDSDEEKCIAIIKGKLLNGIERTTPKYLNLPSKITISYEDGVYYIYNGSKVSTWEEFRKVTFNPEILEIKDNYSPVDSCVSLRDCNYVAYDINEKIFDLVDNCDTGALKRLIMFLRTSKSSVELYRLNRNGEKLTYTVKKEDGLVANFMHNLCCLIPSVIRMKDFSVFEIKNFVVFKEYSKMILKRIVFLLSNNIESSWKKPRTDNRDSRPWQEYSTKVLTEKYSKGDTASILVIEAGYGKSKVAMDVLKNMITQGIAPPYCVWSLPSSAIESVIKEISLCGFDYKYVHFRGIKPASIPMTKIINNYEKGVINIVTHDNMKNIKSSKIDAEKENMKIASDTFFIFDEIHKVFNGTKKTSAAVEFATSSPFFLGMTGTLYPGNDPKIFQKWLNMMVDFEVGPSNQWLGVASLVSSKINTEVEVEDKLIDVKMNETSKKEYSKYVPPQLGGNASSINLRSAKRVCDEVCLDEIVNLSVQYVKNKTPVFVVAQNTDAMNKIIEKTDKRLMRKLRVFKIEAGNSIEYSSNSEDLYDMIITTPSKSEGYTLTKIHIMITGVYFGNQATRTQLRGRLTRLGQQNKVTIITVATGILTYVNEKYKKLASFGQLVSALSKEFKVEDK